MGRLSFKLGATLAVAGMLVVAGCDDDDAPAPITTTGATGATGNTGPITPEELIDEGDPICAEAYTALASAPANVAGSQQASIVEGLIESLQSLGDPGTENEADLDDFYDGLEDAQKAYEDEDTASADAALAEARAAAGDYGFKDCGEEGEALSGAGAGAGGTASGDTGAAPTEPAPTEPAPTEPPPDTSAPPAGGTDSGTVPPDTGGGTGSDDTGGTGGDSGGVSP